MSIDAMKQALEALLEHGSAYLGHDLAYKSAITALRAAIEQAQEPVAWMHNLIEGNVITHRPADIDRHPERWTALYTAPPPCPTCEALARSVMMDQTSHDIAPRQWKGLTGEEVAELTLEHVGYPVRLTEAIEAKLKEKNT